jgi:hypothetical protein
MIGSLVALIALSSLLLPLDVPQPPDFGAVLQQLASQFTTSANQLLVAVDGAVIDVTRAAYITVLLLGVFLYFTRLHRRLGRELITGGVVLAILSEFVFPLVSRI